MIRTLESRKHFLQLVFPLTLIYFLSKYLSTITSASLWLYFTFILAAALMIFAIYYIDKGRKTKSVKKFLYYGGNRISSEDTEELIGKQIMYLDFSYELADGMHPLYVATLKEFLDDNVISIEDDFGKYSEILAYQSCLYKKEDYFKLRQLTFAQQCEYFGVDAHGGDEWEPEPHW